MKTRYFYLDLLRVLAIWAVILLHCINTLVISPSMYSTTSWNIGIVLNEISRAGVPLFLMISGYLMLSDARSADIAFFYKKRLPRILIPLLIWCAVYYAVDALTGADVSVSGFFAAIINNGTSYHMWFVYTLAGIYLITPFLKKLIDTLTKKQLLVFAGIILTPTAVFSLINVTTPIYIYLFSPLVEGYLGFFIVGYILGSMKFEIKLRISIILAGIPGAALGIVGNILHSDSTAINVPFNGGYMINHYLVAASLFVLAKTVDEKVNVPTVIKSIATKLSDISFGVYWVHVLAISATVKFIHIDTAPIIQSLVHFVIVSVSCTLLMLVLSYIKPIKKLIM